MAAKRNKQGATKDERKRWFHNPIISLFISSISILIAGLAFYQSYISNEIAKKTNRLHIDPVIDCFFFEEQSMQDANFIFKIKNSGPLSIVSLSVDFVNITYDINQQMIVSSEAISPDLYEKIGKNWHFEAELIPMEITQKSLFLPSLNFTNQLRRIDIENVNEKAKEAINSIQNSIEIFYFRLKYYRESDMNEYNKPCVFFLDSEGIYNERKYKAKGYYHNMVKEVASFLKRMDALPAIEERYKAN